MKAYWINRCHVFDMNKYSKYIELAGTAIASHGGKFLVRGGDQVYLEGKGLERTVVVEFQSKDQALKAYNSAEYQKALKFSKESAERQVVIVEAIES